MSVPENPNTRIEMYLNNIATGTGSIPEYPETRLERYLDHIANNPSSASTIVQTTGQNPAAVMSQKAVTVELDEVKEDLANIYHLEYGTNLFDNTKTVIGAIQSDGTIVSHSAWSAYFTSDYIKLEANTDYYFAIYNINHTVATNRKLLLLYDANKNIIQDSWQNVDSVNQLTFNTSSNVKYVRISSQTLLGQVAVGTTYGTYEEFTEEKIIDIHDATKLNKNLGIENAGKILLVGADGNVIANGDYYSVVYGKNKFNPDTVVIGAIQNDGTIATNGSWASYSTSEFIEIQSDKYYTFSAWGEILYTNGRLLGLLFDEDKNPITDTYQNVNPTGSITFSPTVNAKYIRISLNIQSGIIKGQVEEGSTYTRFRYYEAPKIFSNMYVREDRLPIQDVLYGKKWAVIGDSFTDGASNATRFTTGRYSFEKKTYPFFIGNRTGIDVLNFFASGRQLAFPNGSATDLNSVTNPNDTKYYQNIPADVDYITLYIGINDAGHSVPLGTINDNDVTTYYGAYNVVLSWLIENRPNAHIGIIISNGLQNSGDFVTAQMNIAKKYGLPYLNLNGDQRTPAMLRCYNTDIAESVKTILLQKWSAIPGSDTHPNDAAEEFESTFIENFLRSI